LAQETLWHPRASCRFFLGVATTCE